jgi:nucleoside-diphosphate-sugar epimerase
VFAYGHQSPATATATTAACDVTDIAEVQSSFAAARPDCVFHLASKVTGARSIDLVRPTLATNLVGTVNVLLAASDLKCSSIVCLGSLQEPDQELPPVPCAPYAAAKFAASSYARMFAEVFALPVTIARPLMVYGPGQLDFTKLVPYVARRLIRGETAELSSGKQAFDWVYVDDVVDAVIAVAERPDLKGHMIDIGCGVLTTVAEVASGIGHRLSLVNSIKLGAIADRRLEPTRMADTVATARLIGWRARVSLQEGLDRSVDWYRSYLRDIP